MPDTSCNDCQRIRTFDPSKSSTYQNTGIYILNESFYGVYGQDFVRLGNTETDQLIIPNAMFAQRPATGDPFTVDGVMGFGFTAENPDMVDPPIVTAVKAGILDRPIVTLVLKGVRENASNNTGGVITYGAVDTVTCDRNVVYEPLSSPNSFSFILKKVTFGGAEFTGDWDATIDSTYRFITGPDSVINAFYEEINATYNYNLGVSVVDCDIKFNLNFTIGSTVYTVTQKELVMYYNKDICYVELLQLHSQTWTFGYPWLRTFCNVLDYGSKRVGFSKIITS